MRVLIIEDEPAAARHLERLLSKIDPAIAIEATIDTVSGAVEFLNKAPGPDLILSDIQIADGLSFEIFSKVTVRCPVIFITAYDQYAIQAFEANGIDYLLKPIVEERLQKALDKARRYNIVPTIEQLLSVSQIHPSPGYKSRFIIRINDKLRTIPVAEVTAFYVLGKGTWLHTKENRNYTIEFTLEQLEKILDPQKFFRINRKYIISTEVCTNITVWSNSRLNLKIEGINDEIIVAREKVKDFKEWLDR